MAQNQLSTSDNGGLQIVEESGGHLQDAKEISQICPPLLCSKVCLEYKIGIFYSRSSIHCYFSLFCVVSSWGSFLITPQVPQYYKTTSELLTELWNKLCLKFLPGQIVPGRMGLLVTLFLSLTALLVSTINSSPEVNLSSFAQTNKSKSFFSGCWRHNSPGLLGFGPLFLHLWSDCGLHDSTDIDKNKLQWGAKIEGWWSGCAGLEDW